MERLEMQEPEEEWLFDDEDYVDEPDGSPYWHDPDYPEFYGWRELVV